ncbi:uncharacterized protein N7482_000771 [Penicillium canariense]|uniref:Uncharacterized protein n=1 Tax=Penicillium canariense TaxID=189055 RepID=A0A9W9IC82_9EURO|nr:uncharacterized protein N7482_000771 [Penicillium canariense]KAJ5174894.1 hypothetical protein N7482_000771 [Penicillium canariense]
MLDQQCRSRELEAGFGVGGCFDIRGNGGVELEAQQEGAIPQSLQVDESAVGQGEVHGYLVLCLRPGSRVAHFLLQLQAARDHVKYRVDFSYNQFERIE